MRATVTHGTMRSMKIGDFIRQKRKEALGISATALAERLGVTRSAVSQWENHDTLPSTSHRKDLAKLFDMPVAALLEDEEVINVVFVDSGHAARYVPLIDWVDAGRGAEAVDPYPKGLGVDYLKVGFAVSEATFALAIKGDSMAPEFIDGDVIIVDPKVTAEPNDCIVAELYEDIIDTCSGKCTFKLYVPRGTSKDGAHVFDLVPINPEYPTVTVNSGNPGKIIGVMVEHRKRRRR